MEEMGGKACGSTTIPPSPTRKLPEPHTPGTLWRFYHKGTIHLQPRGQPLSLLKVWGWGWRSPASPRGLFFLVTSPIPESSRCPPRAASLLQRTLLSPQEVLGLQEPVSGPGGRGQCLFFIVLQLPCVFSHPSPPYILKLILFLVRTQQNLPMLS